MANSYNSAAEYLNKMRQELASKKSAGHALLSTTSEYILPVTEASSLTDVVTATSAVIGTYDIVDNVGVIIGEWPLQLTVEDEINTGRSAANNNSGTVVGTETYVTGPEISSTHKIRKAFSFDGSSYITIPNESNFDREYTQTLSLEAWVKTSNAGVAQDYFSKRAVTTTEGYLLGNGATSLAQIILRTSTTTYFVAGTTNICNGLWHHIVGTYAGTSNQSGLKIYVDGVLEGTGGASAIAATIQNAVAPVIGAGGDFTRKLTGSLAGVRMYNIELTQAEVTRRYAGKGISRDAAATNPAYIGFSDIT